MILKSGMIDVLETQFNVAPWKRKVTTGGIYKNLPTSSILKPLKILTAAHLPIPDARNAHPHRGQHQRVRNSPRFNVKSEVVQRALKRTESGLWENNGNVLPLRHHSLTLAMQTECKNSFMLLFRSQWLASNYRCDISLPNLRYNILKPMIRSGHAINVHATDIYKCYSKRISPMFNILGEFIRHGLLKFHKSDRPRFR